VLVDRIEKGVFGYLDKVVDIKYFARKSVYLSDIQESVAQTTKIFT